jgi:hypothetical protein
MDNPVENLMLTGLPLPLPGDPHALTLLSLPAAHPARRTCRRGRSRTVILEEAALCHSATIGVAELALDVLAICDTLGADGDGSGGWTNGSSSAALSGAPPSCRSANFACRGVDCCWVDSAMVVRCKEADRPNSLATLGLLLDVHPLLRGNEIRALRELRRQTAASFLRPI